jgi:hypothetical protein
MSNSVIVTGIRFGHARWQSVRDAALRVSLFCIITFCAFLVAIFITSISPGAAPDDFTIAVPP